MMNVFFKDKKDQKKQHNEDYPEKIDYFHKENTPKSIKDYYNKKNK